MSNHHHQEPLCRSPFMGTEVGAVCKTWTGDCPNPLLLMKYQYFGCSCYFSIFHATQENGYYLFVAFQDFILFQKYFIVLYRSQALITCFVLNCILENNVDVFIQSQQSLKFWNLYMNWDPLASGVQLCICGMFSYFILRRPNTKAHSKLMAGRQALKPVR